MEMWECSQRFNVYKLILLQVLNKHNFNNLNTFEYVFKF